uniref:Hydrolase_4 domain-containing protein n=1 Tax=Rhabditophanes sp. KR3021 TaxID=114890 RepID=A0AC35TS56_9BILA
MLLPSKPNSNTISTSNTPNKSDDVRPAKISLAKPNNDSGRKTGASLNKQTIPSDSISTTSILSSSLPTSYINKSFLEESDTIVPLKDSIDSPTSFLSEYEKKKNLNQEGDTNNDERTALTSSTEINCYAKEIVDIEPSRRLYTTKQKVFIDVLKELGCEQISIPCKCTRKQIGNVKDGKWLFTVSTVWKNLKTVLNALSCRSGTSFDDRKPLPNEKQGKEQIKIYKGERDLVGEKFDFGYNHPCFKLTDPIQFFFLPSNENDTIACAFFKPPIKPKRTIIYSHPNAMNISDNLFNFPNLADMGNFMQANIFTYDYSQYGISSGVANQKSLYGNLRSVIEHTINVLNIKESSIFLMGYSLGGAVSTKLATEYKDIGGLMIIASPASIKSAIFINLFGNKKKGLLNTTNESSLSTETIQGCESGVDKAFDRKTFKVDPNGAYNTAEHIKDVKCRVWFSSKVRTPDDKVP